MKKIAKLLGVIAAVGAAAAGGAALYKKFFSAEDVFVDSDTDPEDASANEEPDSDNAKTAERSYVSLTPTEEPKEIPIE